MYFMPAERLWRSIHNLSTTKDDQAALNYALQNLGVRWKRNTAVKDVCYIQTGWRSYEPLNCIVFSQNVACRGCCGNVYKPILYILHPLSTKSAPEKKYLKLKYMNGWFLSDSWNTSCSSGGRLWLRCISTLNDG